MLRDAILDQICISCLFRSTHSIIIEPPIKNADWSWMASQFLDVFLVLIFLLVLIFTPFACLIHNNSNISASLLVLDNILKLRQNLFHMFFF